MDFMEFVIKFMVSSLAIAYLTDWLHFDPAYTGVFPMKNTFVKTLENDVTPVYFKRRADLTDRIRYLTGIYHVSKEGDEIIWYTETFSALASLWKCPFCLSFWMSFLLSWTFFLGLNGAFELRVFETAVIHFALACMSSLIIFRFLEY